MASTKFNKPVDGEIASISEQMANMMLRYNMPANSSKSFTVESGKNYLALATRSNSTLFGCINVTESGNVKFSEIFAESKAITISTSTNTITFETTSQTYSIMIIGI